MVIKMKHLLFLLLAGCSLEHGNRFINNSVPVYSYIDVNIVNEQFCESGVKEAKEYLLSHKIVLSHNSYNKDKFILCLPTPNWLMRNLSPVSLSGMTGGNVAWVTDDSKVILHELYHLFVDLNHSWSGVMFPIYNPFATGLTEEQLNKLKNL